MSRMGYSQADRENAFRVWVEVWLASGGTDDRPCIPQTRKRLQEQGFPCPSKPTLELWIASEGWLARGKKIRDERHAMQDRRIAADVVSGRGRDEMVEDLAAQILPTFQRAILEINNDTNLASFAKAKALSELATAMDRSMNALGKASPTIDKLGVAQKLLYMLAGFVQEKFPQHAPALLEIIEPFTAKLVDELA